MLNVHKSFRKSNESEDSVKKLVLEVGPEDAEEIVSRGASGEFHCSSF